MNPLASFMKLPLPVKIGAAGVPVLGGAYLLAHRKSSSAATGGNPAVGTPSGSFSEQISTTTNTTIINRYRHRGTKRSHPGHPGHQGHNHGHPYHKPRPTHHEKGHGTEYWIAWWQGRLAQTNNQLGFIGRWLSQAKRTNNKGWEAKLLKRQTHFRKQAAWQRSQLHKSQKAARAVHGR